MNTLKFARRSYKGSGSQRRPSFTECKQLKIGNSQEVQRKPWDPRGGMAFLTAIKRIICNSQDVLIKAQDPRGGTASLNAIKGRFEIRKKFRESLRIPGAAWPFLLQSNE